jgi:hypothetical protein
MSMMYEIHEHDKGYGFWIVGAIPISELTHLMKKWGSVYSMDLCDAHLAEKLSAAMVVTSKKFCNLWREELGLPHEVFQPNEPKKRRKAKA